MGQSRQSTTHHTLTASIVNKQRNNDDDVHVQTFVKWEGDVVIKALRNQLCNSIIFQHKLLLVYNKQTKYYQ